MLDEGLRRTILELHGRGLSSRRIARLLDVSRGAVREVIKRDTSEVPSASRAEKAEPYRDEILALHLSCKGNLVRVHEELLHQGASLSYQALTAFCRRQGIGREPKKPAGRYHFEPGAEMQHDTSPHRLVLDTTKVVAQTASLVLCYSRLTFFQLYPRFDRFTCKVFLTDALQYVGGACKTCMVDNTNVIVLHGTGRDMVPAAEMEAFAKRYGFISVAHEKGDANRSGRVERRFHHIENNFLAGRRFADWPDLNAQAREWCDRQNAAFRRHLHASPRELFAQEQALLVPLPEWAPEVYRLHQRIVDVEGFVSVHGHRYSVPYDLLGRHIEVRETKDRILLYRGPREVAVHDKVISRRPQRVTEPSHRPRRGEVRRPGPTEEEKKILAAHPNFAGYLVELKRRSRGLGTLALRRLLRMVREYPESALGAAVQTAHHYGMYDMERLERMVLRNIHDNFFTFRGDNEDSR
jgi:transposase